VSRSSALIVNLVTNRTAADEIIEEHPDLMPEDIQQALKYVANRRGTSFSHREGKAVRTTVVAVLAAPLYRSPHG
jgi:hypothetical protein